MGTTIARVVLMALGMALGVAGALALVLPLPAAAGVSIGAAGLLGMIPRRSKKRATVAPSAADAKPVSLAPPPPADPEMLMPRWRRPSLQAARYGDGRLSAIRAPMTFDARHASFEAWEDETAGHEGAEVLRIRLAVVPLLDVPDEVLGDQVAELVRGDEVAVVQAQGAFRFVACPDGRRGWLHRTSLVEMGADEMPDPDTAPVQQLAQAR